MYVVTTGLRLPAFFILEKWVFSTEGEIWYKAYGECFFFFQLSEINTFKMIKRNILPTTLYYGFKILTLTKIYK